MAALGNETADEKIVAGLIFDGFEASKFGEAGARSGDGGAEGEFHSFNFPIDKQAGVKIGNHPDGEEIFGEGIIAPGHVKAGDGTDFGVGERRDHAFEVVGGDADVTIADDDDFVFGFANEAAEFGDFVIGSVAAGAVKDADGAMGEFANEFFKNGDDGIFGVGDAEEDFVFGVIEAAEAGEVCVGVGIEAADGFEDADGWGESVGFEGAGEKAEGAVKDEDVVDGGDGGDEEKDGSEEHCVISCRI